MTRYAQVVGGQVAATHLPAVGVLADGSTVSNYAALPADVLADEGWLPLEDERPDYDPATQQLVLDRYDIAEDAVTAVYVAQPLPPPEPTPPTRAELDALIDAVATLTLAALEG